jgi:A/G-specific adenine glycosylase
VPKTTIPDHRIRKFRKEILAWFEEHGRTFPWRTSSYSAFQLLIAEILLQRTRAETVAGFIDAFFQRFPAWEDLANASTDEIGEFLKPIGLWRRRAAGLKALAETIVERGGVIPTVREELEALPAVGQYIANSALLLFSGHRAPLLDVNMARVLERYFGPRVMADIRYDPYLQNLAFQVVDSPRALSVNWAILDFAAKVCTARWPKHEQCPLANGCQYYAHLRKELKNSDDVDRRIARNDTGSAP